MKHFFFFLKEEVEILNMNWIIIKKDRGNILSRVMNLLFLFFLMGVKRNMKGQGKCDMERSGWTL